MSELSQDARLIFDAGLKAADPCEAVRKAVRSGPGDGFSIGEDWLGWDDFQRVIVVGAGKAACPMARAVEEIFGDRIAESVVVTKYGHTLDLARTEVLEAGHPVPDENGVDGARRLVEVLERAGEGDLVLCLISGGGSALLPMPAEGVSLEEKQRTTRELLACGADIHEINTIRKHVSRTKGGRLAKLAHPARLAALILSDVIGDDLDTIASGPTVPDPTTFSQCLEILRRYGIGDRVPETVLRHLRAGRDGDVPETPKPGDPVFDTTSSTVVGSGRQSLEAARNAARQLGYNTMILSAVVEGETREVARVHAAVAREIADTGNPLQRPACVLSGGETTVTLNGDGKGGRNTEFALAAALAIEGMDDTLILSAGTDGTDGPTDAAGAWAEGHTAARAREQGLSPREYLDNNDSYTFFDKAGGLLKTGPTMTNVMDLRIVLVI
ncbi:MAG: glycerate kinase [Desulfatibacillaceae bacterium]